MAEEKKRPVGRPRVNHEFEDAVFLVRQENLQSVSQYKTWWKLHTPSKIPKRPDRAYKNEWKGWGYFLGHYNEYPFDRKHYRSFEDAREFAHRQNFKSLDEWHEYAQSGKKPKDIPSRPDIVYRRNQEWHTWNDFLGNRIDDRIIHAHRVDKFLYIGRYAGSERGVYCFGVTTSLNNLRTDHNIGVVRVYEYEEIFDWEAIVKEASKPYYLNGRNDEYLVMDMGYILSEFSMNLIEYLPD